MLFLLTLHHDHNLLHHPHPHHQKNDHLLHRHRHRRHCYAQNQPLPLRRYILQRLPGYLNINNKFTVNNQIVLRTMRKIKQN